LIGIDQVYQLAKLLMLTTVGDLRRFIAGSPDNRTVRVVITGLGAQDNVYLQNTGSNLTIVIKPSGGLGQAQVRVADAPEGVETRGR
jgi:hypothetical protein